MRKQIFENGEFYHVYNRGVDKRIIFQEDYDVFRFIQGMKDFNTVNPIGSIYEKSFLKDPIQSSDSELVNIIAYCLNPNHYHFILEQIVEGGISKYLGKLAGGYTYYFNEKYDRSGSLFQGPFKVKPIKSNDYLLHASAYVNLNDRVHQLDRHDSGLKSKSSWSEYTEEGIKNELCKKAVVLDQFKSKNAYKNYAEDALGIMLEKKLADKELVDMLME